MRAVILVLAALALGLGALATPALAGGWAVTTFDELPGQFVTGQTYVLGYTIRQHGITPRNVDGTEIVVLAASGKRLGFPGTQQGAVGHYTAAVSFPATGTYTWQVTQGIWAPQDLGTLTVLAAQASDGNATDGSAIARAPSPAVPAGDPVRTMLPFAAAAAIAMFLWRTATVVRAGHRARVTS